MQQFEIFDGNRYLFTVMPSENPRRVLQEERKSFRNSRLRLVMVEDGQRTQIEGPSEPEPEEEFDFGEEEVEE